MTQFNRLNLKVTVQGRGIYPINIVSASYLLNPLNDFHVPLKYAESGFKDTVQGHVIDPSNSCPLHIA